MTGALRHAQACFRTWMVDDALPVWATAGRDAAGFGFQEHLTLDGLPAGVPFKRMRVQARQIYVFSHAHHLGLFGGIDAAADALRFITAEGDAAGRRLGADAGPPRRRARPGGGPV